MTRTADTNRSRRSSPQAQGGVQVLSSFVRFVLRWRYIILISIALIYYLSTLAILTNRQNLARIRLASSNDEDEMKGILRTQKQVPVDAVRSSSDNGMEPPLDSSVDGFDKTAKVSLSKNVQPADISIEKSSRAFPIWIEKRLAVDSNISPYGFCVSGDLSTNNESPKGLLFVKVPKSSSSTGAGVTLRIRDGLTRRLTHTNQTAHGTCFAHYRHSTARRLKFHKRDPSQSFLWSIVREPAQRTISAYFFFDVSRKNKRATEDGIIEALKRNPNGQSKYLDLPSYNLHSSSTDRIINGYDFLAVTERMEESLVVLSMLARIPLTDVVVFNSKVAGGYDDGKYAQRCVKLKKKWTTPKIEEFILGDYQSANKDDYLLYNAAQRSLDKTIDFLGRQLVEEKVELLKILQQQNEDKCARNTTMPCPAPEDDEDKLREHTRLTYESCYFGDVGCGHTCTEKLFTLSAEKEWASITSSFGQG